MELVPEQQGLETDGPDAALEAERKPLVPLQPMVWPEQQPVVEAVAGEAQALPGSMSWPTEGFVDDPILGPQAVEAPAVEAPAVEAPAVETVAAAAPAACVPERQAGIKDVVRFVRQAATNGFDHPDTVTALVGLSGRNGALMRMVPFAGAAAHLRVLFTGRDGTCDVDGIGRFQRGLKAAFEVLLVAGGPAAGIAAALFDAVAPEQTIEIANRVDGILRGIVDSSGNGKRSESVAPAPTATTDETFEGE